MGRKVKDGIRAMVVPGSMAVKAQAEQHLARLDSLCVFGCAEYRMLKTAIANYKQGKKPTN